MKNNMRTVSSVFWAAALCISSVTYLTACGSGSSSKNEAVHTFYEQMSAGNADGMFEAAAPSKYWDYLAKRSGLSKDQLYAKFLEIDDISKFKDEIEKNKDLEGYASKEVVIKDLSSPNDATYSSFKEVIAEADIDDEIEEMYYATFDNFANGYIYKLGNQWYYGYKDLIVRSVNLARGK